MGLPYDGYFDDFFLLDVSAHSGQNALRFPKYLPAILRA
jgi:hypothetical protein